MIQFLKKQEDLISNSAQDVLCDYKFEKINLSKISSNLSLPSVRCWSPRNLQIKKFIKNSVHIFCFPRDWSTTNRQRTVIFNLLLEIFLEKKMENKNNDLRLQPSQAHGTINDMLHDPRYTRIASQGHKSSWLTWKRRLNFIGIGTSSNLKIKD